MPTDTQKLSALLCALTPPEQQRSVAFTDPDFLAKIPRASWRTVFLGCQPVTIPPGETHTFAVEVFRATRIERILTDGPGAGYHITVVDCAPPLQRACSHEPSFHQTEGMWECPLEPRFVAAADSDQPAHASLSVTLRNDGIEPALIACALHGIELT